jgi:hypothetical protein
MIAIRIRPAIPSDWPAIESWRAGHFLEMAARMKIPRPVTNQSTLDDGQWIVLERDGKPVAATSFSIHDGTCFAQDLFAASGHVIDGLTLGRELEKMCDREGWEMRAQTDPENTTYLRILQKRGFTVSAIELKRQPKGASDAQH